MDTPRELSCGEKTVGLTVNPSRDRLVSAIKAALDDDESLVKIDLVAEALVMYAASFLQDAAPVPSE